MKKKMFALMGILTLSSMMLFTGCRSTSVSSGKSEKKTTEEETTKKSTKSTEDETEEEETTKKSTKSTEDETEKETEKETKEAVSHDDWSAFYGTGYTLYISDDWTETEASGTEVAYLYMDTASDGFAENINAMTQDLSAYDMDLESYKELSLNQYEQLGYDVLECEPMTVNDGTEGYYCVSSVVESGITCYIAQYFTVVDETAFIFTFAADSDGYAELEDEVIEIYEAVEFD
ncbi:MAG: hypothetical protein IJA27_08825 [Lachnospiraceae bacterium]|nr:hypothetical protein [Lachnospiraceae bacterium]